MNGEIRELIEYLEKQRRVENDEVAGVVITDGAAFNIINTLELLCAQLAEAEQFILEMKKSE